MILPIDFKFLTMKRMRIYTKKMHHTLLKLIVQKALSQVNHKGKDKGK